MKKLLFGLLFSAAASVPAFGQITLEHTYNTSALYIFKVSETETKYVVNDRDQKVINIYSSEHNLEKSVSYSKYGDVGLTDVSKHTFDLDDEYELLLNAREDNIYTAYVIEENGTEIFKAEKGYSGTVRSIGDKAKLQLFSYGDVYKIYSLVGKHYTSIPKGKEEEGDITTVYPNPSLGQININHGISGGQQAEVKVYNMAGQVVSTTAFSTAQATVSLSTSGLPAGTYVYVITSGNEMKQGQFLVGE